MRGLGPQLVLVSALLSAGCGVVPATSDIPVTVANDTDVAVGLYLDGAWVGTYAPGAQVAVPLPVRDRFPVTVELRSPSDAVLVAVALSEDQHAAAEAGGYGGGESQGLPCGTLTLLVGRLAAAETVVPPASVAPGACP
jgi:hypothetical protein